jgi:outer membrane protein OmpA-like peptidoglycan-associated protein
MEKPTGVGLSGISQMIVRNYKMNVHTGDTMILTGLNFPSGSAQLNAAFVLVLDRLATLLRDYDMLKMEIIGHIINRVHAFDNLEFSK